MRTPKAKPATSDTFTLIIWEEVPENTKLYLVPNSKLDEEDLKILRRAHRHYINGSEETEEETAAADCLNNAFCTKPEHLGEDHPIGSKWAMRFADCELEEGPPVEDKVVTRIIVSGFLL